MKDETGVLGIHITAELPNRRGGNSPPPPNYAHALGNNMPYMETQLHKFCQVHSINAYLGNQAINPMEVMQFAEHMHMHIVQKTGNPIGLSNHYNTGTCPWQLLHSHHQLLPPPKPGYAWIPTHSHQPPVYTYI